MMVVEMVVEMVNGKRGKEEDALRCLLFNGWRQYKRVLWVI